MKNFTAVVKQDVRYKAIEFLSSLWGAAVFSWSPFDIWHNRFIYWTCTSHSSQSRKPLGFHGNITKNLVFPIPRGRHPIIIYGHFLVFFLVTDIINIMFCKNFSIMTFNSIIRLLHCNIHVHALVFVWACMETLSMVLFAR